MSLSKRSGKSNTLNENENVSNDSSILSTVGVADIENIVQKAVTAAVLIVRDEFAKLIDGLSNRVRDVEERLMTVEETLNDLSTANQRNDSEAVKSSALTCEFEAVRRETREAMKIANDTEQYIRRNNLRIRGLEIRKDVDCREIVVDFIKKKLNVSEINVNDIEAAHTLPTSSQVRQYDSGSSTQSVLPTVIVRFHHRHMRDEVMRNRRALKGSRITIIEDLTALNVQTLNRAKNHPDILTTWTWNGKIMAVAKNGTKLVIRPFTPIQDCPSAT